MKTWEDYYRMDTMQNIRRKAEWAVEVNDLLDWTLDRYSGTSAVKQLAKSYRLAMNELREALEADNAD